jgi:hypothetical protein
VSAANPQQAARQARALLARALPGSRRGSVRAHLQRAGRIGEAIWRRWQVSPYQWQAKHLRWYLEHHLRERAPASRYDHWRTVRALLHALGQAEAWTPRLRGPWLRPGGDNATLLQVGRSPKLPGGEPVSG